MNTRDVTRGSVSGHLIRLTVPSIGGFLGNDYGFDHRTAPVGTVGLYYRADPVF